VSCPMTRYYFDIRDGASFCEDEDGHELEDLKAAEIETAETLADIAKEFAPFEEDQRIVVEVRTAQGPVLKAMLSIELAPRHE
jgi:hypothetical protein